jgi:hypothetical protein
MEPDGRGERLGTPGGEQLAKVWFRNKMDGCSPFLRPWPGHILW